MTIDAFELARHSERSAGDIALADFLQRISTPFHSGWFAYSKLYLAQIPIKLPKSADEKRQAQRITESVRAIMAAKAKLRGPFSGVKGGLPAGRLSDRETRSIEAKVEAHEKRIDEVKFDIIRRLRKREITNFWEGKSLTDFGTSLTSVSDIIEDASDYLHTINLRLR